MAAWYYAGGQSAVFWARGDGNVEPFDWLRTSEAAALIGAQSDPGEYLRWGRRPPFECLRAGLGRFKGQKGA